MLVLLLLSIPVTAVAGDLGKGEPDGTPGQWYLGATPSYVAPEKSPIVFVHGLNSSATTWWENNDMYNTAYANGYETAFVDLYPTQTMWDNGALLAAKLQEINDYFGEKLVVVAHSKGGIDTQAALVHYGAYPYVERVITLSSPHRGSELADLAYSGWAGWLADIIGSKSDATYSLQTGYMAGYRSQTDSHPNLYKVPFYTMAGTAWGSFGSSLYWGGLYLSSYGPNDGAVTVQSSRLPYAPEVAVGDWNHSEIREGSHTFYYFEPLIYGNGLNSMDENTFEDLTEEATTTQAFYRGGTYSENTSEIFMIEDGVSEVTIDWMSDKKNTSLNLVTPDGQSISNFSVTEDTTSVFKGAYHHTTTISLPTPGTWTIEAHSPGENYFLGVYFSSDLNHDLHVELNKESQLLVQSKGQNLTKDKIKATVTLHYYKNEKAKAKKLKISNVQDLSSISIPKLGSGIYNVTVDYKGVTNDGNPFNRTKILSFFIDEDGDMIQ